jgi:hypothetical protein
MGEDNFIIALVPEIKVFGIIQATLINKIRGWIKVNTEQKRYNFGGKYWSGYISATEFMKQTGLPKTTIKENIKKLCDLGIIFYGTHNKHSDDRTRWYWIDENKIIELLAGRETTIDGREPSKGGRETANNTYNSSTSPTNILNDLESNNSMGGRETTMGQISLFEYLKKSPSREIFSTLCEICGNGFDVYYSKNSADSIVKKYYSEVNGALDQEQFKIIINQIKNN